MSINQSSDHKEVLTKEAVITDPLVLALCFERHAAPYLKQPYNSVADYSAWLNAIKSAEATCDNALLGMTVSELFDVYARYLDQSPLKHFPYKEDGEIFDSVMQSDRNDYYSMGVRELQSVACAHRDVKPHIKYGAVLPGPLGIEDINIMHLVGKVYGRFPGNVYKALKAACS